MGYQLYWVGLAPFGWVLLPYRPIKSPGVALSFVTSGGLPLVQVNEPPEPTQAGAMPLGSTVPLPLRSAGFCRIKIAFGLTRLVPGAVGGIVPRENPSCNHSWVTGWYAPAASRYSTRR